MKFSVVVPVFNSQIHLRTLFKRLKNSFEKMNESYEVIFVDDHSRDNSWQELMQLKKEHPSDIILIQLKQNYGQHNATCCGLTYAKGAYIITIDDDLQNNPEDIELLFRSLIKDNLSLIYGVGKKEHSVVRKIMSSIWKSLSKRYDGSTGEGSSFRLFTQALNEKVVTHQNPVVYIDELLHWYSGSTGFADVKHNKREKDNSNYSGSILFGLISKLVFTFTIIPIKIIVGGGFLLSIISFLLGVYFIIRKLYFEVAVSGFTAIIVTVLFSTSIVMISLGVIAKYLGTILSTINKKPSYTIKEIID